MSNLPDDLIERMVELVQWFASRGSGSHDDATLYFSPKDFKEARAIAALLPKPVDPLILRARKIALKYALPATFNGTSSYRFKSGSEDEEPYMLAIIEALREADTP